MRVLAHFEIGMDGRGPAHLVYSYT